MKKVFFALTVLGLSTVSLNTTAQDDKDKEVTKETKKESQEIIIRKKGDKDTKMTIEINGDNINIDGKPLSEYKDDNVVINKRNITVWDKDGNKKFEIVPDGFMNGFNWSSNENDAPRAFLGVTTDADEAGAKIMDITKGSPAEKAGLKKGDIITKVGDKKIGGPDELTDVIGDLKPKNQTKVYYKRDGKENSVDVTLGERKESRSMTYSFSGPGAGTTRSFSMPRVRIPRTPDMPPVAGYGWGEGNNDEGENFAFIGRSRSKLGIKIQDTEDESGVKALNVDKDSPAEKAGLKKDDIITEIGGKKVTNTDEAREELHENADRSAYTIKAKRNGSVMSFDIKIPKKLKTTNL